MLALRVQDPTARHGKKSKVDFKTGEEHQQQLSQFSEEVRDGPVRAIRARNGSVELICCVRDNWTLRISRTVCN